MQSTAQIVITAARTMVQLGYAIVPVRLVLDPVRPDGQRKKRPIGLPTDWSSGAHGVTDPEMVAIAFEHFARPEGRGRGAAATGYAILTGESRIVVVDLDAKPGASGVQSWTEAGGPPSSFTVTTWSGGTHLFFADPERQWGTTEGLLPGVDTRGRGGLVFGPGSVIVDSATAEIVGRYTADSRPGAPSTLPPAPATQLGRSRTRTVDPVDELMRGGGPQSESAARMAIANALANVTKHAVEGWEGFRSTLRDSAFTLGGYVGAEFCTHDDAAEHLARAIKAARHEPDDNDLLWIEQGLADGARKPFRVVPDPIVAPAAVGADANTIHEDSRIEQARGPRRLSMIPAALWSRRLWMSQLRDNFRARDICPDAGLGAYLAIFAGNLDHHIRIDTGTKSPITLTLLVGLVGPSGSDKSTAFSHAMRYAPLDTVPALPTPSGEGLAEQMMGLIESTNPVDGKPLRERVQTGHNALYWIDEGEVLSRTMDRNGSTLGGQLRSAWSGQVLGNTNASEERRRTIPAGSYNIGVAVGYQPRTAVRIIADTHTGMAQRFLWFSALDAEPDSNRPHVTPEAPRLTLPHITRLAEAPDPLGVPGGGNGERVLAVEVAVTDIIVREQRQRRAELDITVDDPDSQRHVMVAKVAALLCLIDDRALITLDDWDLASELYAASARVRDELATLAEEAEAAERHESAARQGEADSVRKRYAASVQRVAATIVRKAVEKGSVSRGEMTKALRSTDRVYRDQAIEFGLSAGWIIPSGAKFAVGPAAPI